MNIRVWSIEEEELLIKKYKEDKQSIEEIAEFFNKNNRSIITKLVQLKIYEKPNKDKSSKRTVKMMLIELEEILGIQLEGASLTKKSNLELLVDAVKNKFQQTTN